MQEQLASGGMGTVSRALDKVTGQQLAMKRMRLDAATRRPVRDAFEREFQVLASLNHPRIIRVFDYGVDALGPYYTMELLDGEDLARAAPLPYREACRYLRDIATCLALLHARRLIHRDVSAGNVRKTRDGHCKLLDFGALMPFGKPTAIMGTPPGVPPEALDRSALDQRVDCYALGALAYHILTGRQAYPAHHMNELLEVWKTRPAAPSSWVTGIPPALDDLVLSLLSLDRLARPENVAEVIARLT
jgi:serine/threonine protein kinase